MGLLAIDLGTTGVRALLIAPDGTELGTGEVETVMHTPAPGFVEQRVEAYWRGTVTATRAALDTSGLDPADVRAIGFSHQRCTFALADADGQPVTDLVVWMDQRGLSYLDLVHERVGLSSYYDTTGLPIYYISSLSKLLWLRDNLPAARDAGVRMWPISNFILARLGIADPPVDHATASFFGVFDTRVRTWAGDVIDKLGLDAGQFPALVPPCTVVGELADAEAAAALGLPTGIPVVIGGGDQQCAALGSGMIAEGQALLNLGTATAVMAAMPGPARDPSYVIPSVCHVVPGQWEMEGHTQASGIVLQRFRDEFADAERQLARRLDRDVYDLLAEQAARTPPGAEGLLFLPTLNGTTAPVNYPYGSGVLAGLRLTHSRAHVIRAMLEGMGLENRWILEQMAAVGARIESVFISGGGSKSAFWNQLHADILQRAITRVSTKNAAAVGAAICAGIGTGLFPDAAAGVAALSRLAEVYEPDLQTSAVYDDLFAAFQRAYGALQESGVFSQLYQLATAQ